MWSVELKGVRNYGTMLSLWSINEGRMNEFDLLIIGGGAGAFAAAIKANEPGKFH